MSSGGEALSEALAKVNRKWLLALVVGLVLAIIIHKVMSPSTTLSKGMTAPEFALESTNGKMFTLAKLRGVPVILSFWSTDCEECIPELAGRSQFAKSHPEVQLLGVAVDSGDLDALADARAEHDISYPILESNAEVEASYGVDDLPLTMLIDDQGIIRQVEVGPVSTQRLNVWVR
jgi:peroxiredoxin